MPKRGRPRTLGIPFDVGTPQYQRAYYELNREKIKKRSRDRARLVRKLPLDAPDMRLRTEPLMVTRWPSRKVRNLRKSAEARGIHWDPAINARWVRAQFALQQGRCFYTGVPFVIEATFRGMRTPSIDRIDSSKGYTRGNTVLCLTAINYLKNDYPVSDVIDLLLEIVALHG